MTDPDPHADYLNEVHDSFPIKARHQATPGSAPKKVRRRTGRRHDAIRAQPCAYCGGPGGTVDHYMPIALGGDNRPSNLRPCCHQCNRAKGNMHPDDWNAWLLRLAEQHLATTKSEQHYVLERPLPGERATAHPPQEAHDI